MELNSMKVNGKDDPDITWRNRKIGSELAPVFAKGPGSAQFIGFYSPEDIYKKLSGFIKSRR